MFEKISETLSSNEIAEGLFQKLQDLAAAATHYFSGTDNLRTASIILILLAFILFIFLIIIIYVKSMVTFLKSENTSTTTSSSFTSEDSDDENINERDMSRELEKELERELERELELSRSDQQVNEQNEKRQKEEKKAKEEKKIKNKQKEEQEKIVNVSSAKKSEEKQLIGFDWKKGTTEVLEKEPTEMEHVSLAYHQNDKTLVDLTGLIIDMLSRGVDDLKIAQAVMFRNQGKSSEEEILQLIEAIKDFTALCINKKFSRMERYSQLPDELTALTHLAEGDTSVALSLLENLMDENIDRGATGIKKDEIFRETSGYACTFGTLAALHDIHLATGSFELAIELAPQNVNAWNGLGGMYHLAGSKNKASQAYQNVLDMADEDLFPRLTACARKILSQYYYDQGNSLQAAKLYNDAKQYYDSIGINRRLDRQEAEIIQIIENNQNQDLSGTIQKLLANNALRQYSYAI